MKAMRNWYESPIFVCFKSPFRRLFFRQWFNHMLSILYCIEVIDRFDWHSTYREYWSEKKKSIRKWLKLCFCDRLPYDWRTPAAYFLTMIGQLFAFYFVASVYLCTFIMFFGICFYLVALYQDCDTNFNRLEQTIIEYSQCQGMWSINAMQRLRANIHELIQFHCDTFT